MLWLLGTGNLTEVAHHRAGIAGLASQTLMLGPCWFAAASRSVTIASGLVEAWTVHVWIRQVCGFANPELNMRACPFAE
jgi:hypothetical protein